MTVLEALLLYLNFHSAWLALTVVMNVISTIIPSVTSALDLSTHTKVSVLMNALRIGILIGQIRMVVVVDHGDWEMQELLHTPF